MGIFCNSTGNGLHLGMICSHDLGSNWSACGIKRDTRQQVTLQCSGSVDQFNCYSYFGVDENTWTSDAVSHEMESLFTSKQRKLRGFNS